MLLNWLAFGAFVAGYFIHLYLKIDEAVRDKSNPANSRWGLIKQNAAVLLARFFFSAVAYGFVRSHPELLSTLAGYANIPVAILGQLTLVTNIPLSGVFGYEVDSLLGYIPGLKNQVPQFPITAAELAERAVIAKS
jgi:hypothetical protein